jgi:putative heme degradation protein
MDVPDQPRACADLHRQNPDARVRDIAGKIGITERVTQMIVSDWKKPAT